MWKFLAGLPTGTLYVTFAFIAAVELYFFMIQRSALEIARVGSLDARTSRYMLPLWFVLHWPIQVVKWLAVFLIFRAAGLMPAALCLVIPFLISQVIPIPHRHFIPTFRRRVSRDLTMGENLEIAASLQVTLESAVRQLDKGEGSSA